MAEAGLLVTFALADDKWAWLKGVLGLLNL